MCCPVGVSHDLEVQTTIAVMRLACTAVVTVCQCVLSTPGGAQLVDLVARILALVPPWVRIYRIQRDIPMPLVTSGVEKGNLRELALARMGHLGLKCRDVRTREVGIQDIHHKASANAAELRMQPQLAAPRLCLTSDLQTLACLFIIPSA